MRLTITLDMDGAAFEADHGNEAARILEALAREVRKDGPFPFESGPLLDSNGNTVGRWEVTE